MGVLRIETSGSFPYRAKHFGAMEWGHAHAVAEAIEWLANEVLPAAIAQDHRLQASGAEPRLGFGGRNRSPETSPPHVQTVTISEDGKLSVDGPLVTPDDGRGMVTVLHDAGADQPRR